MQNKNSIFHCESANPAAFFTNLFHDWQRKVYLLLLCFLLMLIFSSTASAAATGFVARSEKGCYHKYCYVELLDSYARQITGQTDGLYEDFTAKTPVAIYTESGLYFDYGALLDIYALAVRNGEGFNLDDYLKNADVDRARLPSRFMVVTLASGTLERKEIDLAKGEEMNVSGGEEDEAVTLATKITGPAKIMEADALKWAESKNAHSRFIGVAPLYWKYGEKSGIRPEVLFAQAAHETGFGHYRGIVPADYNNWAGIKTASASGNEPEDHKQFDSPEDGVRAHFNHMSAYVGLPPIGETHCRFEVVNRLSWAGTVETIEDLSGRWAPSATYHVRIINMLKEMDQ